MKEENKQYIYCVYKIKLLFSLCCYCCCHYYCCYWWVLLFDTEIESVLCYYCYRKFSLVLIHVSVNQTIKSNLTINWETAEKNNFLPLFTKFVWKTVQIINNTLVSLLSCDLFFSYNFLLELKKKKKQITWWLLSVISWLLKFRVSRYFDACAVFKINEVKQACWCPCCAYGHNQHMHSTSTDASVRAAKILILC